MGRYGAEQGLGHHHVERCGNTLARYVSDAEEQFLVADIEVKQIAAHLLGGSKLAEHVNVIAVGIWRENLGNHGHLDGSGYLQLVLYPVTCLLKFVVFQLAAYERYQHECQHGKSQKLQQFDYNAVLAQRFKDIGLRYHYCHCPAGMFYRGVIDIAGHTLILDCHISGLTGHHGFVQIVKTLVVLEHGVEIMDVFHYNLGRRAYHDTSAAAQYDTCGLRINLETAGHLS